MARRRPSRSNAPTRRSPALALAVAVLVAGCTSLRPAAPTPPSPEALAALDKVESRWAEFKDLRSLAEIEIRRSDRVQRTTGVLLLRSPSALRFEALSPFGTPILIVAADPEWLTIWEVPTERAYRLPATPEANRRWLGLAMGGDELVAILSGRVIPLRDPTAVELLPADEIGPALFLRGADRTQRIWLDPATGEAKGAEWTGGPNPARVIFTNAPGGAPAKVALGTLDGKLAVTVAYKNPQVNSAFDPALLKLDVPEHVRIQEFR